MVISLGVREEDQRHRAKSREGVGVCFVSWAALLHVATVLYMRLDKTNFKLLIQVKEKERKKRK